MPGTVVAAGQMTVARCFAAWRLADQDTRKHWRLRNLAAAAVGTSDPALGPVFAGIDIFCSVAPCSRHYSVVPSKTSVDHSRTFRVFGL